MQTGFRICNLRASITEELEVISNQIKSFYSLINTNMFYTWQYTSWTNKAIKLLQLSKTKYKSRNEYMVYKNTIITIK